MNTQPQTAPAPAEQMAMLKALSDPAVRRQIRADPRQYALDHGLLAADSATAVEVVVNRPGTLYVPIARADAALELNADDLQAVQAAGSASTAGTASSAATAGTLTTTVSTASSTGCAGCAGSLSGRP